MHDSFNTTDTLTIFASPKGFSGHEAIIQTNAIRSWKALPGVRVILFGSDPGIDEAAKSLGCLHFPEVKTTEYGTPILSDMFLRAEELSDTPIMSYINADIILFPEFTQSIQASADAFEHFLLVGQRWDIDVHEELDFEDPVALRAELLERCKTESILHPRTGMDFFCYRRGFFSEMPPFIVARTAFDNWFIKDTVQRGFPVIDSTKTVFAVHQNHGYGHVKGEKGGSWNAWHGPEARKNQKLAGIDLQFGNVKYATHEIVSGSIQKKVRAELEEDEQRVHKATLIFEHISHAIQSGNKEWLLHLLEKFEATGIHLPGLHALRAGTLFQINRAEEGVQYLQEELRLFPGHKEAQGLFVKVFGEESLQSISPKECPNITRTQLNLLGEFQKHFSKFSKVLCLGAGEFARFVVLHLSGTGQQVVSVVQSEEEKGAFLHWVQTQGSAAAVSVLSQSEFLDSKEFGIEQNVLVIVERDLGDEIRVKTLKSLDESSVIYIPKVDGDPSFPIWQHDLFMVGLRDTLCMTKELGPTSSEVIAESKNVLKPFLTDIEMIASQRPEFEVIERPFSVLHIVKTPEAIEEERNTYLPLYAV